MEESIDRLMRACGLRSFAYRRYPAIHIAPPSPTPVSSNATGPDEHRATPGGDVAASGPLPPEDLQAAPAVGPAERAAGPGRAGLTAPVRLRRPKRPAAARADSVQEPVHQAGPSQGLRSRVAPAVTLAPSTRATASAQPAAPLAAPGDSLRAAPRATSARAGEAPRPAPREPAGAAPRRFALLDEVSAEVPAPRAETRPARSASEAGQDTSRPGRPRPRLRLHSRNGGTA